MTYLDDITAAGGDSSSGEDSSESATALRALAATGTSIACQTAALVAGDAVPEPPSVAVATLAAIASPRIWRRRRCVRLSFSPLATAA
jgi:hypothetical protein